MSLPPGAVRLVEQLKLRSPASLSPARLPSDPSLNRLRSAACRYFGNYQEALKSAGINLDLVYRPSMYQTPGQVVTAIKCLPQSQIRPGKRGRNIPTRLYNAARRHFGNWTKALLAADLDPPQRYPDQCHTRREVIRVIRSIPASECAASRVRNHSTRRYAYKAATRLFQDGWNEALSLAGRDYKRVRRLHTHSAEDIIEYIRLRKAEKLSLCPGKVRRSKEGHSYYNAAMRYWRDTWISQYLGWPGAVEEAGFDPVVEGIVIRQTMIRQNNAPTP